MIATDLLKLLCCPETHQPLTPADPALVARLNAQIAAATATNRGGKKVVDPIDGGLIRADGKFLYPIRKDIPMMLVDEALPL
jgi:uncharacterized protein YbaR (Trm112 family)